MIPNPAGTLSFNKAVDAGLVDAGYAKLLKKLNAEREQSGIIGFSVDHTFSSASAVHIKGIGAKTAKALEDLGVESALDFARTRGGMGFAELIPQLGAEQVTKLRNIQQALKACLQ
jgi:hypothetical protein